MDLSAPDLHDLADGNRLITPDVEHSLEDEVRVDSGGSKGGRIAGLEGKREQDSGVERAVVVGIARQHEPVGQGFGINRVLFGHGHADVGEIKNSRKEGGRGLTLIYGVAPVGIEPTTSRL